MSNDERINLRCPTCGSMRRPVISPLIPDHVVVICDACMDRRLDFRFEPYESPDARGWRVGVGMPPLGFRV